MKKVLIGLVAVFALTAAACGSDNGDTGDMAGQIQEAAAADGEEITDEEAACAAEYFVAVLGESEAQSAIEAAGDEGEAALDNAFEEAFADLDPEESMSAMEDAMADMSDECLELLQAEAEVGVDDLEAEAEMDADAETEAEESSDEG